MKIALVAESFLPQVNGVTHSVLRVLEHLQQSGHTAEVLAARPATGAALPLSYAGARIHWLPSMALPGYPEVRLATPNLALVRELLRASGADVVHLASPFRLGWDAVRAAAQLGLPTLAVYQTDVPSYAARYGVPVVEPLLWRRVYDIHTWVDRTLAPSSFSAHQLRGHEVPRVHRWARGVDASLFHPDRRDAGLRGTLGADERVLVGYVGRLAAEKQVEDLRVLADLPRVRLVVIGDGPLRARLERSQPTARFLGWQGGEQLAAAVASLDVVVHPGEHDTFGQTIQEAMASGVPVVGVARGGPTDLIDDGRTGLLYPVGRLDRLRAHVARLAAEPELRGQLGLAARAAVEDRSWSRMGELLLQHYAETIATAGDLLAA